MFGFLRAPCSGCHSKEHSVYRAHFCGLCNRLRQDYGLPMRFLVNRDATFLSLLGNGLAETPSPAVSTTCCNPLGKPRQVVQDGDAVTYAAAVTMCGLHAKLEDEVADRGKGPSRLALQGLQGMLSRPLRKAQEQLRRGGFPLEEVKEVLAEQPHLEQDAVRSGKLQLETVSHPSAFAFGKIVRHTGVRARDSLEIIGQSLGKLIYSLDAYVDRKRDARTGQFNPFLLQPALVHALPESVDHNLNCITDSLSDLPLTTHREVLDSILGTRLQQTCMSVLNETSVGAHPPRSKQKKKSDSACCECVDCCGGCDWIFCCDSQGGCCDDHNKGACDAPCCDEGCCDAGCCDCDVGCCICDCS